MRLPLHVYLLWPRQIQHRPCLPHHWRCLLSLNIPPNFQEPWTSHYSHLILQVHTCCTGHTSRQSWTLWSSWAVLWQNGPLLLFTRLTRRLNLWLENKPTPDWSSMTPWRSGICSLVPRLLGISLPKALKTSELRLQANGLVVCTL